MRSAAHSEAMFLCASFALCLLASSIAEVVRRPSAIVRLRPDDDYSATHYYSLTAGDRHERVFRDGATYRYAYEGQVLTGLPETSAVQFSGLKMRASVELMLREGAPDRLSVGHFWLGQLRDDATVERQRPSEQQPVEAFQVLPAKELSALAAFMAMPVEFEYERGMVSAIRASADEPSWSINVKRSMLSMLSVNLDKRGNVPPSNEPDAQPAPTPDDEPFEVYRTSEPTIGGHCQVLYTIERQPAAGDALNVTKVLDYTKCSDRPVALHSMWETVKCAECADDTKEIIESSASIRYGISGSSSSSFLIDSVALESQHSIRPHKPQVGTIRAIVNATMRLVESKPTERLSPAIVVPLRRPRPIGVTIDDVGRPMEFDISNAAGTLESDYRMNRAREISTLMHKLAADFRKEVSSLDETPPPLDSDALPSRPPTAASQLDTDTAQLAFWLTRLVRGASFDELLQAHDRIVGMSPPDGVSIDDIIPLWSDIVAASGSPQCIRLLKHIVVEQDSREWSSGAHLSDERIAQLLSTLSLSIKDVDERVVDDVLAVCKTLQSFEYSEAKKTCYLTFGSLVHKACVDATPERRTAITTCSPTSEARYLHQLTDSLTRVGNSAEKIMLAKALGNAGLVDSLPTLAIVAKNADEPLLVRTQAVYAMRRFAKRIPERVVKQLLPLYLNTDVELLLRVACFHVIAYADAGIGAMQQIALSLHNERSLQLGGYVYSYLVGMANSTLPCNKRPALDATLALKAAKELSTPLALRFSKHLRFDFYERELEMGVTGRLSWLADETSTSNNGFLPQAAFTRWEMELFGQHVDVFEGAFEANFALDKVVANLATKFSDGRSLSTRGENSAESSDSPVAHAYMKLFGKEVRFVDLSASTVERYMRALPLDRLGRIVRGDESMELERMDKALMALDSTVAIPCELGFPLHFSIHAPVVAKMSGRVRFAPVGDSRPRIEQFDVNLQVDVAVAGEILTKMDVGLPTLTTGAGFRTKFTGHIPIDGTLRVDLPGRHVHTSYNIPQSAVDLLTIDALPMTYTKMEPLDYQFVADNSEQYEPLVGYAPFFDQHHYRAMQQPSSSSSLFPYAKYGGMLVDNVLHVPFLYIDEIDGSEEQRDAWTLLPSGGELGMRVQVESVVAAQRQRHLPYIFPLSGRESLTVTLKPTSRIARSLSLDLWLRGGGFSTQSLDPVLIWQQLADNTPAQMHPTHLLDESDFNAEHPNMTTSSIQVVQAKLALGDRRAFRALVAIVKRSPPLDGVETTKLAIVVETPTSEKLCVNGVLQYPDPAFSGRRSMVDRSTVRGLLNGFWGARTCHRGPSGYDTTGFLNVGMVTGTSPERALDVTPPAFDPRSSSFEALSINEARSATLIGLKEQCKRHRQRGILHSRACQYLSPSELAQYRFDVEYDGLPSAAETLAYRWSNWIKAAYYWNGDYQRRASTRRRLGHVTALVKPSADGRIVDVDYTTPVETVKLYNVAIPSAVLSMIEMRSVSTDVDNVAF